MPTAFETPQHWRERAEEARSTAEGIKDPEAKRAMLVIARSYEKIAERAEAREVEAKADRGE
jgi:hypothetical protein